MKILVTSDWHLDHVTLGVSRHDELRETVMGTLLPAAREEKVDAVFFLGDLADPDSGPAVLRAVSTSVEFARALEAEQIESFWLAGNHDVIEDGTGLTVLSPIAAVGGDYITVAERPGVFALGGHHGPGAYPNLVVVALPFTATSHAYDPAEYVEVGIKAARENAGPETAIVVVGHLSVPGVIPGEEVTEMPRGREVLFPAEYACANADLVLHGHYHRQQLTPGGIWIPGSLACLTFGEAEHHPGYLLVEV